MGKSYRIKIDPFDHKVGSGHVDYSGFGVHGKFGKSKSKDERRKNRAEAKRIQRAIEREL